MSSLSQADIDALMAGDTALKEATENTGEIDISEYTEENGTLTLEMPTLEISTPETEEEFFAANDNLEEDISEYFSPTEIDALGEIGNICMGTSATTMYTLLGRKVTITTPTVALYKPENILANYRCPFLAISVEFVEGLFGRNLLIIKDYDAALITDLLMGGEGIVDKDNIVLNEIHLSAMSEVMNQMMGSSATAMSNMMNDCVNITPPQVSRVEADESITKFLDAGQPVVKISFDMEIEGLLKSKLLQIMPIDVGKELIASLMHVEQEPEEKEPEKIEIPVKESPLLDERASAISPRSQERKKAPPIETTRVQSVKPATYQSFDDQDEISSAVDSNASNFDLINDIPLQVTVELGKTKKNLSDVLNFGVGSIIVLDKQAGDLVDVIVNGKKIAKGEVVIIEENYGVRITEILRKG